VAKVALRAPLRASGGGTPAVHDSKAGLIDPSRSTRSTVPSGQASSAAKLHSRSGVTPCPISRATMAPSAKIGSGAPSRSAAGATPPRISSRRIELEELEPIVAGIHTTRPFSSVLWLGCRGSDTRPVSALTPPQKLIGASNRSRAPSPTPRTNGRPCFTPTPADRERLRPGLPTPHTLRGFRRPHRIRSYRGCSVRTFLSSS